MDNNTHQTIANGCKITRIVFINNYFNDDIPQNISINYDNNKITSVISTYQNFTERIEFVYEDNSDKVKEMLRTRGTEYKGKIVFKHDSSGQIIESENYNSKNVLNADNIFYQYNSTGELSQENHYYLSGAEAHYNGIITFQWEENNCVKMENLDKNEQLIEYYSITNNMPKRVMQLLRYVVVHYHFGFSFFYMNKNLVQNITYKHYDGEESMFYYTYTFTEKGLVENFKERINGNHNNYNLEYRFEYSCE